MSKHAVLYTAASGDIVGTLTLSETAPPQDLAPGVLALWVPHLDPETLRASRVVNGAIVPQGE